MHKYCPPLEPYLSVIYADEALLVLEKPSGLLSVPGRTPAHSDSLASRAQAHYPGALTVHRLDMDTSGLMVMARHSDAHRRLSAQFQKRQVEKVYCAKVWGELEDGSGEIDLPLICDWPNRPRQKVDFALGKPSLTRLKKISASAGTSLVRLHPVTGRSHQLRVHLQAIGHPILGDPFYAHPQARAAAPRLLLHATELAFSHPLSGEWMRFKSEPDRSLFRLTSGEPLLNSCEHYGR